MPTLKVGPQNKVIKKSGEYYVIMSNYNSNYDLTNKHYTPSLTSFTSFPLIKYQ